MEFKAVNAEIMVPVGKCPLIIGNYKVGECEAFDDGTITAKVTDPDIAAALQERFVEGLSVSVSIDTF